MPFAIAIRIRPFFTGAALLFVILLASCGYQGADSETSAGDERRICDAITAKPVRVAGGTFQMGQAGTYAEEGPVRETEVDGFWIDRHEVTNGQFARFVEETGHITRAEKPVDPSVFGVPEDQIPPDMLRPGSAVFSPPDRPSNNPADWWRYVPGTTWRRPYGPDGNAAKANEPVVHLAWDDMLAYAKWAGGRLPSEAEWEFAAAAGKAAETLEQPTEANSWQGIFPVVNEEKDGFSGAAPVACYAPNALGIYDMIGNVWEATADYYQPGHDPEDKNNPRGANRGTAYDPQNPGVASRVIKGGSFLCAPNYCQRYRSAARQGNDPELGTSHIGFRLVYDEKPETR